MEVDWLDVCGICCQLVKVHRGVLGFCHSAVVHDLVVSQLVDLAPGFAYCLLYSVSTKHLPGATRNLSAVPGVSRFKANPPDCKGIYGGRGAHENERAGFAGTATGRKIVASVGGIG